MPYLRVTSATGPGDLDHHVTAKHIVITFCKGKWIVYFDNMSWYIACKWGKAAFNVASHLKYTLELTKDLSSN
jgi:hypothetical protein